MKVLFESLKSFILNAFSRFLPLTKSCNLENSNHCEEFVKFPNYAHIKKKIGIIFFHLTDW